MKKKILILCVFGVLIFGIFSFNPIVKGDEEGTAYVPVWYVDDEWIFITDPPDDQNGTFFNFLDVSISKSSSN